MTEKDIDAVIDKYKLDRFNEALRQAIRLAYEEGYDAGKVRGQEQEAAYWQP